MKKQHNVDPDIALRIGCWTKIKGVKCTICARHIGQDLYRYKNINTQFAICHGCALLMMFDLMEQLEFYCEPPKHVMSAMELAQSHGLKVVNSWVMKRYAQTATNIHSRYRRALNIIRTELEELDRQAGNLDF